MTPFTSAFPMPGFATCISEATAAHPSSWAARTAEAQPGRARLCSSTRATALPREARIAATRASAKLVSDGIGSVTTAG
jgi:hypothetical protein